MTKYIFTLGGVVSSLGKGIASASIGCLLKSRGYKVRLRKIDPYLNLDPGTMSPYQHGEVFVTEDGAETDLDLGHYERFADINCHKTDSISGGRIYFNVLQKERRGDYLGATVQAIPHVTNAIKHFLSSDIKDEDFVLYEVGGTVGDIEATLIIEAIRQFINDMGRENCLVVLLTLLPYIATAGELKTKPTQHAVKSLMQQGIQADILLCRGQKTLSEDERKKIALFCNVSPEDVVNALDVKNIHEIPIAYHAQGLDVQILKHFHFDATQEPDLSKWQQLVDAASNYKDQTNLAVVGKYCGLPDTYKSLNEAITHAAVANQAKVNVTWIESEQLEGLSKEEFEAKMAPFDGVLVPGGFGSRGIEGKIRAIEYARSHKKPYFGICLGMQTAVIEAARHLLHIDNASSTEFTKECTPIITRMQIWEQNGQKHIRPQDGDLGGTMRLGAYPCKLTPGSLASRIYGGASEIAERHRHRFEMDIAYAEKLKTVGVELSGISPDGLLPEIIEIPDHPFFIGVQFHPEFTSRPGKPNPIFRAFIEACLTHAKNK